MTPEELTKHINGIEKRLGPVNFLSSTDEGGFKVVIREHANGFSRTRFERSVKTENGRIRTRLVPVDHKEQLSRSGVIPPLRAFKTCVMPALPSKVQDQPTDQFDRAVAFLITNYSVVELAGAYLNATSGDMWKRITESADRMGEYDASTVFRRPS